MVLCQRWRCGPPGSPCRGRFNPHPATMWTMSGTTRYSRTTVMAFSRESGSSNVLVFPVGSIYSMNVLTWQFATGPTPATITESTCTWCFRPAVVPVWHGSYLWYNFLLARFHLRSSGVPSAFWTLQVPRHRRRATAVAHRAVGPTGRKGNEPPTPTKTIASHRTKSRNILNRPAKREV